MKSPILFPYLLFINNFSIYYNIYYILKAFYLIPTYLSYKEYRKLTNIFTLLLRPYNINLKDIIKGFYNPI